MVCMMGRRIDRHMGLDAPPPWHMPLQISDNIGWIAVGDIPCAVRIECDMFRMIFANTTHKDRGAPRRTIVGTAKWGKMRSKHFEASRFRTEIWDRCCCVIL